MDLICLMAGFDFGESRKENFETARAMVRKIACYSAFVGRARVGLRLLLELLIFVLEECYLVVGWRRVVSV